MSPKGDTKKDVHSFYAEDPEAADKEFFGRVAKPDRRGFLKRTGLATMTADNVFVGKVLSGGLAASSMA